MSPDPRLSTPTLKVLGALMSATDDLSGADVARATGLASGTLYPILIRLEEAGWLASQWEKEVPEVLGRPRRRIYRVTGLGARKARAAMSELSASFKLAWGSR